MLFSHEICVLIFGDKANDLEGYIKCLALNFLVHNGEYSNEVFFYIDPEI